VDYREEHGPFESLEALMEVSGIGPGIFEGVRDYISID
jgi:competence ComEA-like helix-hairpin-helix protein